MFQIFKKKEKVENVIAGQTGKYPAIVEEIHDSFFTSADKLLEEAQKVLKEKDLKDVQKGIKLKSLGFNQALQVKEAEQTIKEREKAEKSANIVLHYKHKYPFNKFITEESVNAICKKYGLVQGGLELYKGFVPEEKVEEIFRFKEKKDGEWKYSISEDLRSAQVLLVKELQVYNNTKDTLEGHKFKTFLNNKNNILTIEDGYRFNVHDKYSLVRYLNEKHGFSNDFIKDVSLEKLRTHIDLSICAPAKDMDLKGSSIINNKVIPNSKLKVTYVDKDPVVLQPVKHGYLIVSAWGDEASDPLVVNEINN